MKDTSVIPEGPYCYVITSIEDRVGDFPIIHTKSCPYWSRNKDKEEQESGYCSYLEKGDWEEDGTMLLWDGCKECGINRGDEGWSDQLED